MTSRQLIVMRHAKAGPHTQTDHERGLTPRGMGDAAEAGAWLAMHSFLPDHAVVSSAARAVGTWEAVASVLETSVDADFSDALYNANARAVIEMLQGVPEGAERVIYVGHNPTAEEVAHIVDDGEGDPEAIGRLKQGLPTAALAVFDVSVPWAELSPHTGRVLCFHVGRTLAD